MADPATEPAATPAAAPVAAAAAEEPLPEDEPPPEETLTLMPLLAAEADASVLAAADVELAADFDEADEIRLPARPAEVTVENATSSAAIRRRVPVLVFMETLGLVRECED